MPEPFSATAPIKAIKGSETKPGVTISGDEDTGLYSPGPDQLAVTVGGSDAGKFTSTGLEIEGDINLDDGGTYTTTVQMVTPTANRTISFPNATGTLALVAGSSGQAIYNNGGALAGISTMTFDGTSVTLAGRLINSYSSLASAPAKVFTGTWFTGGTSTTTKPHLLIEPSGTTSTAWSTSGTGLGVNAASGFSGRLLDLQTNGTSRMVVQGGGKIGLGTASPYQKLTLRGTNEQLLFDLNTATNGQYASIAWNGSTSDIGTGVYSVEIRGYREAAGALGALTFHTRGTSAISEERLRITSDGKLGIGTATPGDKLEISGAGAGIILASPDGTRYSLTVANGGTLSIAAV